MIAKTASVLCCTLILTALPALTLGEAAEKAEIFPSLRKKKQQSASHPHAHANVAKIQDAPVARDETPDDIVVPDATNIGPDGFPQLSGVTQTLKSINTEASTLEAKMVQAQLANQAAMARKKATFEQKLKLQESQNRQVIAENGKIGEENGKLQTTNAEIRKHAKDLQDANRLMRTELRVIQQKLGVARNFVMTSLQSTDDSKAKELVVLNVAKPKKHRVMAMSEIEDNEDSDDDGHGNNAADDEDDDEKHQKDDESDGDDDDKDDGESFLALSSHHVVHHRSPKAKDTDEVDASDDSDDDDGAAGTEVTNDDDDDNVAAETVTQPPANPANLLDVLGKGVAALSKQERDSEAKLKAMYNAEHQAGARRHAALIRKQQALNHTRASLTELQNQLRNAESHLEDTKDHLSERLRGLGLFMQKVAHLALAPASEAPRLMDNLPGSVSIPAKPVDTVRKVDEVKEPEMTFDN